MTILLGGCKTVGSNPILLPVCPPLTPYDKASQQQAVRELKTLPKGSVVGRMMTDYGKLRDACRAL